MAGGGVAAPGGGEGGDDGRRRACEVAPGGVPRRGGKFGEGGGGCVEAGRDRRRRGQPGPVWHAAVRSLPVRSDASSAVNMLFYLLMLPNAY